MGQFCHPLHRCGFGSPAFSRVHSWQIPPRRPGRNCDCFRCVASVASAIPADVNPATDPIFALIERHRAAAAVYDVSNPDADPEGDELALAEDKAALKELLTTRPITLAGCAAVLRYVASYDAAYDISLFDLVDAEPCETFLPLIADAIECLTVRA